MAFRTQKISQMTPKGADLEATDLIEVSTIESGSYVTRSITGQELIDAIPLPPTGLTVGTTPIASGTIGRVLFQGTGNVLQQSSSLFWDGTNNRLGIGTSTPTTIVHINGNAAGSEPSLQIRQQANTTPTWFAVRNTDNLAATGAVSLDLGISGGTGQFFAGTAQGDIILKAYSNPFTSKFFLGTGNTAQMVLFPSTNNIGINTTTDAGFRLDVNGTARVQGNTTVALNQNAITSLTVQNNTVGTSAQANITVTANSNSAQFTKLSTGLTPYKTLAAGDLGIYNTTSDISLLTEGSGKIKFAAGGVSTAQMTLFATGNLGINTTTDAGFRLDVNGTARVSGDLTTGGSQGILIGVNGSGITAISNSVQINSLGANGTTNSFYWGLRNNFNVASATNNLHTYAAPITYAGGTNNATMLNIIPTINTSGGTTNVRGIYYNPTLTSLTGTTHHAFHSTSGRVRLEGLPTSPTGLASGDLWNDAGTLKIV